MKQRERAWRPGTGRMIRRFDAFEWTYLPGKQHKILNFVHLSEPTYRTNNNPHLSIWCIWVNVPIRQTIHKYMSIWYISVNLHTGQTTQKCWFDAFERTYLPGKQYISKPRHQNAETVCRNARHECIQATAPKHASRAVSIWWVPKGEVTFSNFDFM